MLTQRERKLLVEAATDARDRWEQSARNYGVISRRDDRTALIPAATAARKQKALTRKIEALDAALAKLK